MSALEKTRLGSQRVAPPTSMYSMKRTSAGTDVANSTRSTSSSSLTPRMTTVSILVPTKPTSVATRLEDGAVRPSSGQQLEALRAERVETDGDAIEPGGVQVGRVLGEEHPIRRDGQVAAGGLGRQHLDRC